MIYHSYVSLPEGMCNGSRWIIDTLSVILGGHQSMEHLGTSWNIKWWWDDRQEMDRMVAQVEVRQKKKTTAKLGPLGLELSQNL